MEPSQKTEKFKGKKGANPIIPIAKGMKLPFSSDENLKRAQFITVIKRVQKDLGVDRKVKFDFHQMVNWWKNGKYVGPPPAEARKKVVSDFM